MTPGFTLSAPSSPGRQRLPLPQPSVSNLWRANMLSGLPVKLGSWSWGGGASLCKDMLEGTCQRHWSSLCENLGPDAPWRGADVSPEQNNF